MQWSQKSSQCFSVMEIETKIGLRLFEYSSVSYRFKEGAKKWMVLSIRGIIALLQDLCVRSDCAGLSILVLLDRPVAVVCVEYLRGLAERDNSASLARAMSCQKDDYR